MLTAEATLPADALHAVVLHAARPLRLSATGGRRSVRGWRLAAPCQPPEADDETRLRAAAKSRANTCATAPTGSLEQLGSTRTDLIVSVSCPQIFEKPLIELATRGRLDIDGAILRASSAT